MELYSFCGFFLENMSTSQLLDIVANFCCMKFVESPSFSMGHPFNRMFEVMLSLIVIVNIGGYMLVTTSLVISGERVLFLLGPQMPIILLTDYHEKILM